MDRPVWGSRARIGILVNHNDAVPESELWAMAPDAVTIHTARFRGPRSTGAEYPEDSAAILASSPEIQTGIGHLSRMRLAAICLCFSTPSYMATPGFDALLIKALLPESSIPMTTAAQATTEAMRALGIVRPFLVAPPWFDDGLLDAIGRHVGLLGLDVSGVLRLRLGAAWRGVKPFEIYDAGGQWEVDPADTYHQVREALPTRCDGVVIVGNGLRSVESIAWLEVDTGLPVITANQASLWHCLAIAGVHAGRPGFGRLLSGDVWPVDA